MSVDIDNQIANNKDSKINDSKSDFEKVLSGESIDDKEKVDEGLDLSNILEDVFKFDELPEDTVRLSASTIEQLFKDTNYSLSEVRRTKKVKPIRLSLLPNETLAPVPLDKLRTPRLESTEMPAFSRSLEPAAVCMRIPPAAPSVD